MENTELKNNIHFNQFMERNSRHILSGIKFHLNISGKLWLTPFSWCNVEEKLFLFKSTARRKVWQFFNVIALSNSVFTTFVLAYRLKTSTMDTASLIFFLIWSSIICGCYWFIRNCNKKYPKFVKCLLLHSQQSINLVKVCN